MECKGIPATYPPAWAIIRAAIIRSTTICGLLIIVLCVLVTFPENALFWNPKARFSMHTVQELYSYDHLYVLLWRHTAPWTHRRDILHPMWHSQLPTLWYAARSPACSWTSFSPHLLFASCKTAAQWRCLAAMAGVLVSLVCLPLGLAGVFFTFLRNSAW